MKTRFRELHRGPEVLVIPNCWDAMTARLFASLGAKALATTSAGVAWAHGFPDGNVFPIERQVQAAAEMVRVSNVPVSVDLEAGGSDEPAQVAENVKRLRDVGVVGVNVEDSTLPSALLASKVEHVRRAVGDDVFVNVRCDVYLKGLVEEPKRLAETLTRARQYRDAGADGLFVPRVVAEADLRELVAVGLPLNVLATPALPDAARLRALGVRRLTAGSALPQQAFAQLERLARAFLAEGQSEPVVEGAAAYASVNALFS